MEITVTAKFKGNNRLGYKSGYWYEIAVCGLSAQAKQDKLPALAYSTIATFLMDWNDINKIDL